MSDSEEETDYVRQIRDLQAEISTMIASNSRNVNFSSVDFDNDMLTDDPNDLMDDGEDGAKDTTNLISFKEDLELLLQDIKTVIQQQSVSQVASSPRVTRTLDDDALVLYNQVFQQLNFEQINKLAINEYYLGKINREIYRILSEIEEIGRTNQELRFRRDYIKSLHGRDFFDIISRALVLGDIYSTREIKASLVTISNLHDQFMTAMSNTGSIERQPEELQRIARRIEVRKLLNYNFSSVNTEQLSQLIGVNNPSENNNFNIYLQKLMETNLNTGSRDNPNTYVDPFKVQKDLTSPYAI